jgi:hypothetical protein
MAKGAVLLDCRSSQSLSSEWTPKMISVLPVSGAVTSLRSLDGFLIDRENRVSPRRSTMKSWSSNTKTSSHTPRSLCAAVWQLRRDGAFAVAFAAGCESIDRRAETKPRIGSETFHFSDFMRLIDLRGADSWHVCAILRRALLSIPNQCPNGVQGISLFDFLVRTPAGHPRETDCEAGLVA